MAVAPDVQVTGKIANIAAFTPLPSSSVPENGAVEIALCGYGAQIPRVGGEALFGRVTSMDAPVNATGQWSVFLYSNGLIEPGGTYYTVTIKDSNQDIVQVEAYFFEPGEWDLSNMLPFDPGQPPPPLPPLIIPQLLIVPFSATPNFDGENFTAWQITLNGDVTSSTLTNILAGNLYTFIILQNATGGHALKWPPNTYNAAPIYTYPSSYTIQTFVADDSNRLYAIGPATWYAL